MVIKQGKVRLESALKYAKHISSFKIFNHSGSLLNTLRILKICSLISIY